ncbi:MAG TPA: serine/threonine-protein kinase [Sedimentisphaerales bacterium]|nr:serine/threonine-protein kinase [Sedimentisphaerales bacterium]
MAEERHCSDCGDKLPTDAPQGLCPKCETKLGLPGSTGGSQAARPASSGKQSDIPTNVTPPAGFVPPDPAELAGQFPQLEILELLGQGGMGVVYKARQQQLDRLVALKILPPQIGRTEAFAERFTREARSLARLSHPRIVMIYDFGHTEAGLYYFIMEFVDGTDLRRVIQAGELSASEALTIIPQICEALQYAHEEGIVHRDIKPENILLNRKGQVRIADFGLAKLLDRPATGPTSMLTKVGQQMGTPHYMAPEQIEHPSEVDHRADIYSLGVVFYEMLTGELPLGRFAPPSQKVQVDVRLDNVVLRTLEKEPERRYQHISEVKTDVEAISSGARSVVSYRPAEDDKLQAVRQRTRAPGIGLMIAGLINCGVALLLLLTWSIVSVTSGATSPGAVITGIVGIILAAMGLLTFVGAQRMMRLQSYGLAVAAGVLQLVPSPGSLLGLPIGIWALIVLTRHEVHVAFVEVTEKTPDAGNKRLGIIAANIFAAAASLIFLAALIASFGGRRFPWFVLFFGPPLLILDVLLYKRWLNQPAFSLGLQSERVRHEINKIIGRKELLDAGAPGSTRRQAVWSFILGIVSLLFASFNPGFVGGFVFVFPPAVFSIFLAVTVIKTIKSYRDHRLDMGLAIAGILAALISSIGLLARIM